MIPSSGWLIVIASVIGFGAGFKVCDWREDAIQLESIKTAKIDAEKLRSQVNQQNIELAELRQNQKPKDRLIYKNVIRYETIVPADRLCTLDGTFRLHHDSAATGEPTETGRLIDDQAEPVKDSTVLATVAENYETCRGWRQDLIAWQTFWRSIKSNP